MIDNQAPLAEWNLVLLHRRLSLRTTPRSSCFGACYLCRGPFRSKTVALRSEVVLQELVPSARVIQRHAHVP